MKWSKKVSGRTFLHMPKVWLANIAYTVMLGEQMPSCHYDVGVMVLEVWSRSRCLGLSLGFASFASTDVAGLAGHGGLE